MAAERKRIGLLQGWDEPLIGCPFLSGQPYHKYIWATLNEHSLLNSGGMDWRESWENADELERQEEAAGTMSIQHLCMGIKFSKKNMTLNLKNFKTQPRDIFKKRKKKKI